MKSDDDFVSASCRRIEEIAVQLGVSPEVATLIGAEWDSRTRREEGGCEVYIAKRQPIPAARKQIALDDVRRTGRVAEAADLHGISRATMYRLINIKR